MAANQPQWPREWLMTDERIGDQLWDVIDRLPECKAGIVFRHYATPRPERADLALRVAGLCRKRQLTLAIARDAELAKNLEAHMVHNPAGDPDGLPFSRSAHSLEEARSACEEGAALLFISPVRPTRSHPGRTPLGRRQAMEIVRSCPVPAIALGGVDRDAFAGLKRDGFYGWAGIDAWLGEARI